MKPSNEVLAAPILKELIEAIQSLRFGSVEITVHDGRVTQIEKREKVRFIDSTGNTAASKSQQ
jgi:hypothetical protein